MAITTQSYQMIPGPTGWSTQYSTLLSLLLENSSPWTYFFTHLPGNCTCIVIFLVLVYDFPACSCPPNVEEPQNAPWDCLWFILHLPPCCSHPVSWLKVPPIDWPFPYSQIYISSSEFSPKFQILKPNSLFSTSPCMSNSHAETDISERDYMVPL